MILALSSWLAIAVLAFGAVLLVCAVILTVAWIRVRRAFNRILGRHDPGPALTPGKTLDGKVLPIRRLR